MVRPRELPSRARVVIVGGGVGGTAIAYHLAQLGERDVVLLERSELTSGSTFHSAGLVGQLRSSLPLTRMMMDSVELYRTLDCGWVECGGIRLACTEEREQEVLRQVAWARTFGLPLELISPEQAQELFPLMDTAGVRCGSYLATDGYLDPSLLTTALAEGARSGGAQIFTHTRVTAIDVEDGGRRQRRVRGVQTEWGPIEAEVVVNAGGMYAAEIGRMAGVRVPIVPFAHEYLVTQPFRERTVGGEIVHLPTLRDPDLLIYFREEGGGLVMGGYERRSAPWALDGHLLDAIPHDFNGRLLEEDWPRFEEIAANSRRRVPAMDEITVTRLINGPEAFTPDNEFCLGESEVRGFFVAAGFCAHGLAGAGGIGKAMAQWILGGRAGERHLGDGHQALRRAVPLALVHARPHERGLRDLLRHPLPGTRAPGRAPAADLERLPLARRARGGVRGEVGLGARQLVRVQRARRATSRCVPAAGRACTGRPRSAPSTSRRASAPGSSTSPRSQSSRSRARARPTSSNACATTASLATPGAITYTQMLNRRGGIECDFTVTRVGEELFSIVTGTAFGNHDLSWIRRHAPGRRQRPLRGRDGALGLLCAVGSAGRRDPRAADARPPGLPVHEDAGADGRRRSRPCAARDVRRRARLGALLPDRVRGRPLAGALGGGARARPDRRRLPGDRLDAPREGLPRLGRRHHRGRDAARGGARLLRQAGRRLHRLRRARRRWRRRRPAPARRLRCVLLEDPRSVALGNEPVRVDGEVRGRVTSGGYGYTVERSIAYAYLPAELGIGTAVEIDVFGRWVGGEIAREPLLDADGERVRSWTGARS